MSGAQFAGWRRRSHTAANPLSPDLSLRIRNVGIESNQQPTISVSRHSDAELPAKELPAKRCDTRPATGFPAPGCRGVTSVKLVHRRRGRVRSNLSTGSSTPVFVYLSSHRQRYENALGLWKSGNPWQQSPRTPNLRAKPKTALAPSRLKKVLEDSWRDSHFPIVHHTGCPNQTLAIAR